MLNVEVGRNTATDFVDRLKWDEGLQHAVALVANLDSKSAMRELLSVASDAGYVFTADDYRTVVTNSILRAATGPGPALDDLMFAGAGDFERFQIFLGSGTCGGSAQCNATNQCSCYCH